MQQQKAKYSPNTQKAKIEFEQVALKIQKALKYLELSRFQILARGKQCVFGRKFYSLKIVPMGF